MIPSPLSLIHLQKNLKNKPYSKPVDLAIKVDHSINTNKSDAYQKEIWELREETLQAKPLGEPIPSTTSAVTTNNPNSDIQHSICALNQQPSACHMEVAAKPVSLPRRQDDTMYEKTNLSKSKVRARLTVPSSTYLWKHRSQLK